MAKIAKKTKRYPSDLTDEEFLISDVIPDDGFVTTDGRDEIPARPTMLACKTAHPLAINPRQMNRALAFHIPDDLADRVFRWNR
jgi:hypothetical protein